ncbi:hypothetical protein chiPu_0004487 [Chiloscyllium punctatum]|uniref:Uncharacterized protein n=1 Tax=Chiloscyllium punctatum TaxID=137246 RepID=A0A401S6Q4_CHIPU|nr:hypothetical protein [Chiloscyllium punctatum]
MSRTLSSLDFGAWPASCYFWSELVVPFVGFQLAAIQPKSTCQTAHMNSFSWVRVSTSDLSTLQGNLPGPTLILPPWHLFLQLAVCLQHGINIIEPESIPHQMEPPVGYAVWKMPWSMKNPIKDFLAIHRKWSSLIKDDSLTNGFYGLGFNLQYLVFCCH